MAGLLNFLVDTKPINSIKENMSTERHTEAALAKWFQSIVVQDYEYILANLRMAKSCNSEGHTALHLAVRANDLQMVHILTPHEAGCLNNEGSTALLIAASLNYSGICKALIPYEKAICTPDGRNALMVAAECGSVDALRALLSAYQIARDPSGTSELDYAVLSGSVDCVGLLLQSYGYSPDDLKIALHLARKRQSREIISVLEHACVNRMACSTKTSSHMHAAPALSKRPSSAKLINTATAAAVATVATSTASRNLISFASEINKIATSPKPSLSRVPSARLRRSSEVFNLHEYDNNINDNITQLRQDVLTATVRTNEILELADCALDKPCVDIHYNEKDTKPLEQQQSTRKSHSGGYLLSQSSSQTLARILNLERKGLASSYLQSKDSRQSLNVSQEEAIKQELDRLTARRTRLTRSLKETCEYNKYFAGSTSTLEQKSDQTIRSLEHELFVIDERIKELVRDLDRISIQTVEGAISPIPQHTDKPACLPLPQADSPFGSAAHQEQRNEQDLLKESLTIDDIRTTGRPKSARLQKNLKELRDSCASVKGTIQASEILSTIERVASKIYGIETNSSVGVHLQASISRSQAALAQTAGISEQIQCLKRKAEVEASMKNLETNYAGILQQSRYTQDAEGAGRLLSSQYTKLSAEKAELIRNTHTDDRPVSKIFKEKVISPERRHELLHRTLSERRDQCLLSDPSKTPLMQSVLRKSITDCKSNLQDAGKADGDRCTALMLAATNGFSAAVQLLVPFEQRMQDKYGQTALMKAAIANSPEVALILREHEAGIKDHEGHTALYYALLSRNMVVAEILKEYEGTYSAFGSQTTANKTELMTAAEKNDLVRVYSLLPAQGRMQDSNGKTALMYAVEANALPCIRLLAAKESGLRTTASHPEGPDFTALMLAVKSGNIEAAEILFPHEKQIRRAHGPSIEAYAQTDAMKDLVARYQNEP